MKAYRSWRKSLCITAGNYFPWVKSITYHTQNTSPMSGSVFSNKLSESLANLATTTSADRATVVTLTDTMAKLSAELAAVQLELVSSLLEKQKILKLVSDRCQRTSRGGGGTPNFQEVNRRDPGQAPLFTTVIAHGFNCPHPSFKCPDLNSTHTKNSTKKDTIGDNQEIYKAIWLRIDAGFKPNSNSQFNCSSVFWSFSSPFSVCNFLPSANLDSYDDAVLDSGCTIHTFPADNMKLDLNAIPAPLATNCQLLIGNPMNQ